MPAPVLMAAISWFHSLDSLDRVSVLDRPGMKAFKDYFHKRHHQTQKRAEKACEYDLFWDAALVWGSFKKAYSLDLFTADLHWWAFMALLEELPEDCGFVRLCHMRRKDPGEAPQNMRSELRLSQILNGVPEGGILNPLEDK